jgi:uncharacterized repeat protein (TIGR03803 family)
MSISNFAQAVLITFVGLATIPSAPAQTYKVLYSFTGGTDGALPFGGVTLDSAGNIYGTTEGDGAGATQGSVFKLSPKGKFTLLHNFGAGGAGGARPYAGLVRDSAGNLYGTTLAGGSVGPGTVFKLDKKNNFSVLYSFSGKTDGGQPTAPVILDPAGNLYGTTLVGGSSKCDGGLGCGVVFKLDTENNETVLYTFAASKYGRTPWAGLLRDAAGNLYGTTTGGGHANFGTVFKVSPAGGETVLSNFKTLADGDDPWSTLIQDAAGNFYGTTTTGGKYNCGDQLCGVVFKVDTNGNETVLYSFNGFDGGTPLAGLIMDAAGNLYGTTSGNVFKLDPSGNLTVLHTFTFGADGGLPYAGLTMDSAGNLYGTASHGGNLNDCGGEGCGVVFKIIP